MLFSKLTEELRAVYISRLLIPLKEAGKLDKTLRESERGKEMSHHPHHHHQAVDNLINVFARASRDLDAVHFKLDKEFQQIYPDNVSNFDPATLDSTSIYLIIQFMNLIRRRIQ